jgi:hypothetical protein
MPQIYDMGPTALFPFRRIMKQKCGEFLGQSEWILIRHVYINRGSRNSIVGIATRYGLEGPGIESRWGEIFRTYPDRLQGPPSLLYNGYWVFPGVRRPGRDAGHKPPSSAEVKKELSYTSTHPMGPPGPVTGFPLFPLH